MRLYYKIIQQKGYEWNTPKLMLEGIFQFMHEQIQMHTLQNAVGV